MPRKPLSIWIGQIVIALAWLFFTGAYVYFATLTWPTIVGAVASDPWRLTLFLARTGATLAAIGLVGWIIVLISRKSPYGRWFGLLLLVLLFAAAVYSSLNPSSPALLPSNDAERAGYLVGQALAFLLYFVLVWRFGFSRAARTFFSRPEPAP
jgi:hypothetical protein